MAEYRDREDGMVERWAGYEGEELVLDRVLDPDEYDPRPEDAYPAESPPHLADCRVIPCGRKGFGISKCVEGCPVLAEGLRRGQELAKEHGW